MRVAKGAALVATSIAYCTEEGGSVGFACSELEPVAASDVVRRWVFLRDSKVFLRLFGVEWFWGSSRVKLGLDTELLSLFIAARREEVRAWHGVLESKDSKREL